MINWLIVFIFAAFFTYIGNKIIVILAEEVYGPPKKIIPILTKSVIVAILAYLMSFQSLYFVCFMYWEIVSFFWCGKDLFFDLKK